VTFLSATSTRAALRQSQRSKKKQLSACYSYKLLKILKIMTTHFPGYFGGVVKLFKHFPGHEHRIFGRGNSSVDPFEP